jgi:glycosyltransferase involved in cell wall biosynthesis
VLQVNIGIDATCWWNNRGFGRFTREVLTAMFQLDSNHIFYLIVDQPLNDLAQFENVKVVQVQSSRPTTEAAVVDGSRSPIEMFKLYRAVACCPLDIMFFPAVYSWFPVPLRFPAMVTVHDAIAEHYPKLIFPRWKGRLFWAIKMKSAVWASQRILTVSRAAKAEIVEYIGADPEIIDVTTEAPSPEFRRVNDEARKQAVRQRYKLPLDAPIIIFVGGLAPHKNLHGLLDGFEKSLGNSRVKDVSLVLVGDFKGDGFYSNYDSLYNRVQSNPDLRERVHFTGYVSEEDLVSLYSTALAVAMPSYSEGFGLPAIEAMACSAPVLASDRGSLPEVVGNAGIYFDPFDVADISRAINEMVENDTLRDQLSLNAVATASGFTWQNAAQLTLAHLEAMSRR